MPSNSFYEYEDILRSRASDSQIPYVRIASLLFSSEQKLIPFLGAGASLIQNSESTRSTSTVPDERLISQACSDLQITSPEAIRFTTLALRIAKQYSDLQESLSQGEANEGSHNSPQTAAGQGSAEANLKNAPSASELASALALMVCLERFLDPARRLSAQYFPENSDVRGLIKSLEGVAKLTSIASTVPSLLSIASYVESKLQRDGLLQTLKKEFAGVNQVTEIQKSVARIAKAYVDQNLSNEQTIPYLIVTTNYDLLMEMALEKQGILYCALTVGKTIRDGDARDSTWEVKYRFGPDEPSFRAYVGWDEEYVQDLKKKARSLKGFTLGQTRPFVIVYKIHGCSKALDEKFDSIVISDKDYVNFIEENGPDSHLLPGQVVTLMGSAPFLFLGYSFNDWNVRSLYSNLKRSIGQSHRDWAVLKLSSDLNRIFLEDKNINLLITDLDRFANRLLNASGTAAR